MLLRERQNESVVQAGSGEPGAPPVGNLDRVRQTGESLFHAADDAIARALSGDSAAFLQATRQEGGQ
jgi:hypothetical protein